MANLRSNHIMNYKFVNCELQKTSFLLDLDSTAISFNPLVADGQVQRERNYTDFKDNLLNTVNILSFAFGKDQKEDILKALKHFEESYFYDKSEINNILSSQRTYHTLVDLIDIYPNNEPLPKDASLAPIEQEIVTYSLAVVLVLTQMSSFATKAFCNLRLPEKFFHNMPLFSEIAIQCGFHSIFNIIIEMDTISQEKLMKSYLIDKLISFLENNQNPAFIEPAFQVLFSFCKTINSFKKNNQCFDLSIKITRKIIEMYASFENFVGIILLKSILVLVQKYREIALGMFVNGESFLFINNLKSDQAEKVIISIEFFYQAFIQENNNVGHSEIIDIFEWNLLFEKFKNDNDTFSNICSYLAKFFVSEEMIIFFWMNGVLPYLLLNYDNYSFSERCSVYFLFYDVFGKAPFEIRVQMIQNGALNLILSVLDTEIEDQINNALDLLKRINASMRESSFRQALYEEYLEIGAIESLDSVSGEISKAKELCQDILQLNFN